MPARVLLQDFTGVPVIVDLASMRSAVSGAAARISSKSSPSDMACSSGVEPSASRSARRRASSATGTAVLPSAATHLSRLAPITAPRPERPAACLVSWITHA